MVLGRDDQRRRRVVMDEAMNAPNIAPSKPPAPIGDPEPSKQRRSRQYSRGADRRNQPRLADLIPTRVVSILIVWLICTVVLGVLNVGQELTTQYVGGRVSRELADQFSMLSRQSVPAWICSICYFVTGLICLQVFSLRQYKTNDYGGNYRLWKWTAILMLVASASCIFDSPRLIGQLAAAFSNRNLGLGRAWLIALELTVIVGLFVRFLVEMNSSRGATTVLSVTAGLAAAQVVFQVPWLEAWLGANTAMVLGNLILLTAAGCLLTVITYARFVALHASGAISVAERVRKNKKSSRKKKSKLGRAVALNSAKSAPATADQRPSQASTASSKSTPKMATASQNSTAHTSKSSVSGPLANHLQRATASSSQSSSSHAPQQTAQRPPADDHDDDDADSYSRLSKAERKRLRKQQKQSRRAA